MRNCSQHPQYITLSTSELPGGVIPHFDPKETDIDQQSSLESNLVLQNAANADNGQHFFTVKGDVII